MTIGFQPYLTLHAGLRTKASGGSSLGIKVKKELEKLSELISLPFLESSLKILTDSLDALIKEPTRTKRSPKEKQASVYYKARKLVGSLHLARLMIDKESSRDFEEEKKSISEELGKLESKVPVDLKLRLSQLEILNRIVKLVIKNYDPCNNTELGRGLDPRRSGVTLKGFLESALEAIAGQAPGLHGQEDIGKEAIEDCLEELRGLLYQNPDEALLEQVHQVLLKSPAEDYQLIFETFFSFADYFRLSHQDEPLLREVIQAIIEKAPVQGEATIDQPDLPPLFNEHSAVLDRSFAMADWLWQQDDSRYDPSKPLVSSLRLLSETVTNNNDRVAEGGEVDKFFPHSGLRRIISKAFQEAKSEEIYDLVTDVTNVFDRVFDDRAEPDDLIDLNLINAKIELVDAGSLKAVNFFKTLLDEAGFLDEDE